MGEPEEADRGSPIAKGDALPEGFLELYKLAVEMADRVSARRAAAGTFYLSAQSALLVLLGASNVDKWALAIPGLVLSATWWLQLRSYRRLNKEKWDVIQEMEKQLPAAPFTDEWTDLKTDPDLSFFKSLRQRNERYLELSVVEQVVPVVFALTYLVVWIFG